jgi:sulfite reductase (NADPH) flavoprotein alpha-component
VLVIVIVLAIEPERYRTDYDQEQDHDHDDEMSSVPLIPDSAPFTPEQRAWLNGFFAGMFSRAPGEITSASTAAAPQPLIPLTILFGSQTGTAESLAKRAAKEAGKRGFAATVVDMAQVDVTKLSSEKNLLVITSTYGDGEPPDNAKALHTQLATLSSPLPALRFSVCSLGDTNYTQFCKCGADFDTFLEKLGATRVSARVDCDLDYEEKFTSWLNIALSALSSTSKTVGGASRPDSPANESSKSGHKATPTAEASGYSRQKPFPARILTSRNLNGSGSVKQVHHVEFDLADSGLVYEAGDALGVYPHNCTELVAEILTTLCCDGEEAVPAPDGSTTSLRHALTELYDLGKPSAELLAHFGGGSGGTAVALHHVVDVLLARVDVKLAPVDFVRALKKLQPRLYSISSSPRAHPGQVHLTVGAVRYDHAGRARKGVCSTFLADRVVAGESRVGVFVHSNKAFRPPADPSVPAIMVGPGTGIAPFRAFLHERRATTATGRNWLFFGDQRAATDFLYRDELERLMHDGTLTRLDTAFSRDQAEKIYVQNRMLEQAAELYAWLEGGAHFYVCGDASRMAKDVDVALHTVIERAGGKTSEQAAAYVQALKTAKRYARDVY